jgi:hypothetical protein
VSVPETTVLADKAEHAISVLRNMRDVLNRAAPEGRPTSYLATVFGTMSYLEDNLRILVRAEREGARHGD